MAFVSIRRIEKNLFSLVAMLDDRLKKPGPRMVGGIQMEDEK